MNDFVNWRFVNYFGTQRLGTTWTEELATVVVGKYLMCGDWKKAIQLLLRPGYMFTVRVFAICWIGWTFWASIKTVWDWSWFESSSKISTFDCIQSYFITSSTHWSVGLIIGDSSLWLWFSFGDRNTSHRETEGFAQLSSQGAS